MEAVVLCGFKIDFSVCGSGGFMRFQNRFFGLWKWPVFLCFICMSFYTFALVPFVDSGKLIRPGKYEVALNTQFISEKDALNLNLMLHLDESFLSRRDMNTRYLLGFGHYGFFGGSFLKWIPFPDYEYQPAVGTSIGVDYNFYDKSTHYVSLHLRAILSKEFDTVVGRFIPYIAFPGSIRIKNFSEVQFPFRVSVGIRGELFFIHFHKMDLNLEFSADFTGSTPSYFTGGIITTFN